MIWDRVGSAFDLGQDGQCILFGTGWVKHYDLGQGVQYDSRHRLSAF